MSSIDSLVVEAGSNELQMIEFYIDEILENGESYRGYYGINVAKVLEIIQMPVLTRIPQRESSCSLGTFNLRGKIIPLVNLACWLKKDLQEQKDPKIIICEFSGVVTAFLVSGVERIYRINWEDVESPTEELSTFSAGTIIGVVRISHKILFLLDIEFMVNELLTGNKGSINEALFNNTELFAIGHKTVLFVDDSSSIRKIIREILQRLGYAVLIASSGKEGWQQLESIKARASREARPLYEYINCVITDIEMPEMDGHTLVKNIKEDAILKIIPVIMYSSIITEASKYKGESVEADYQVSKANIELLIIQLHNATLKQGIAE